MEQWSLAKIIEFVCTSENLNTKQTKTNRQPSVWTQSPVWPISCKVGWAGLQTPHNSPMLLVAKNYIGENFECIISLISAL